MKERAISAALFGRSQSYNNVEDPIVRVTSSDIRKRLGQHYGRNGARSEFHLDLPAGYYLPEFKRGRRRATTRFETAKFSHIDDAETEFNDKSAVLLDGKLASTGSPAIETLAPKRASWRRGRFTVVLTGLLILIFSAVVLIHTLRTAAVASHVLPWSILLQSERATQLIVSE